MKNEFRNGEKCYDRDTIWLKHPASYANDTWKTALPIGNGYTGALYYGAAGYDTLRFTRHDLWAGAFRTGELPDVSDALQRMRDKMDAGDWKDSCNELMDALHAKGFRQGIAEPFPLGQMSLYAPDIDTPFSSYRRGIRMAQAEAFAQWKYGNDRTLRRCFASQTEDAVWLSLEDDRERTYELVLEPCISHSEHERNEEIRNSAKSVYEKDFALFTAVVEGKTLGIAAQIYPGEDSCTQVKNGYLLLKGRSFDIRFVTFVCSNGEEAVAFAKRGNCWTSYKAAFDAHVSVWNDKYKQVLLTLANDTERAVQCNEALLDEAYEENASGALYEKLWRYARYLFMSGTAEASNPFALYGLWCGDYGLPWTQHVANENVEIIYSGAALTGQFDALRGLIRYYTSQMEEFRDNARKMFGCCGIFVPAYTSPTGLNGCTSGGPAVAVPVILNWISCAGWLSSLFVAYYRYTGDEAFLKDHILPFMIETARFYADYVCFDTNGSCRIYPSVSPENTPGNLMPEHFIEEMGHICPTVENATMDFAVMKELLHTLLELLDIFKDSVLLKDGETECWRNLLDKIPAYMIDEATGGVKEWMHPLLTEQPYHRHVSQMYPVFPGNEVRRDNEPELIRAFERSTRNRILGSKSGWAFAHLAALWARLGDGEQSLTELDLMTKSCLLENFFTLHNDWRRMGASLDLKEFAPVQLDALMGAANAIQEMIVYPAKDVLHLLPALPARFAQGSASGLYLPWGRLDIFWKESSGQAVIYAEKNAALTVIFPSGEQRRIALTNGEKYEINFTR